MATLKGSGSHEATGAVTETVWESVPDHLESSKTHRAMVPGGWLVRTTVYVRSTNVLASDLKAANPKSMRMGSHATAVSTSLAFVADPKWQWKLDVSTEHAKSTRR